MQVLIAVDGSSNSEIVLESVAPWLRTAGGSAALLTVLDVSEIADVHVSATPSGTILSGVTVGEQGIAAGSPLGAGGTSEIIEDRGQAIERIEHETRTRLERLAAEHLAGVPCEVRVTTAEKAAPAIIDEAYAWGADAIVVGTHGRTGFRRALMGSVAEEVARKSPFPVFLISAGMREAHVEKAVAGR